MKLKRKINIKIFSHIKLYKKMFSYNDLSVYGKIPYPKFTKTEIIPVKADNSKYTRPNRDLSKILIDDRKKPPKLESMRKYRTEDINIRDRVNEPTPIPRLTNEQRVQYSKDIQDTANKYAMIGERVITKLFKVMVPDPADVDYINRRSKYMSESGATRNEADIWLKENFREQRKTLKSVDLNRMDVLIPTALNIVKQIMNKEPINIKDVGTSINILNDALMNNMITEDDIKQIIDILIKNPSLRVPYTPGNPLEFIALLSNIVVGNEAITQDPDVNIKPVSSEINKFLEEPDNLKILTSVFNSKRIDVKRFIEENKNDDTVQNEDDYIENPSPADLPLTMRPSFLDQPTEEEEEEKTPIKEIKPEDVPVPATPATPLETPGLIPEEEKEEDIVTQINNLNRNRVNVSTLKTIITKFNDMVKPSGEKFIIKGYTGKDGVKQNRKAKWVKILKDALEKWEKEKPEILPVEQPVPVFELPEEDIFIPPGLRGEETEEEQKKMETDTVLSTVGLLKLWDKPKNILDGITDEGREMMDSDINVYIRDEGLTIDTLLAFLNKNIPYIYSTFTEKQLITTKDKRGIVNKVRAGQKKYKEAIAEEEKKKKEEAIAEEEKEKKDIPVTQGQGMKKRGRPKKQRKPKQNRKVSDWVLFVKSVAKNEGIKYGDALKIASMLKK